MLVQTNNFQGKLSKFTSTSNFKKSDVSRFNLDARARNSQRLRLSCHGPYSIHMIPHSVVVMHGGALPRDVARTPPY